MEPKQKKQKKEKITIAEWYAACEAYEKERKGNVKLSQAEFCRSEKSGRKIDGNVESSRKAFGRYFKMYQNGDLMASNKVRQRKVKYPEIRNKLLAYLDARAQKYQRDKCGVSYHRLKQKCIHWAHQLGIKDFQASDGWITAQIREANLVRVNLHGEGMEMTQEQIDAIINPWKEEFHKFLEDKKIKKGCLYNADQTGLYYQKLPNALYVRKDEKKKARGTKQMKDTTRVTLMVCTAANGDKIPLAMKQIQIKAANIDTTHSALAGSFVTDPDARSLDDDDWRDMIETWIDIEEDPDILDAEIDEVMEEMDENGTGVIDDEEADDEGQEQEQHQQGDVEMVGAPAPLVPTTTKEALAAIDVLKKYCDEKDASPDVTGMVNKVEQALIAMRSRKASIQPFLH